MEKEMEDDRFDMAVYSRIIMLCLQFIFNQLLPDHDAHVFFSPKDTEVTRPVDNFTEHFLGGFRRWDAEHYLHIAEHGYSYEHLLAFYPLYPGLVHFICRVVLIIHSSDISFRELSLFVGVVLNVVFFVKASQTLARLTQYVFKNEPFTNRVVFLFSFNPASVFFTAPYTESLFVYLTFSLMLACAKRNYRQATIFLCLSIACRSNGFINFGFVAFYMFQDLLNRRKFFTTILKLISILVCAIVSFSIVQVYFYYVFCLPSEINHSNLIVHHAKVYDLVLAQEVPGVYPVWCNQTLPISYSYVQSSYWNVGFFKYYELKQIPNFALAAPILSLFIYKIYLYYRDQWRDTRKSWMHFVNLFRLNETEAQRKFVFIVHATVLTLVCVTILHIQVSTRLLASASPCLYWFAPFTIPTGIETLTFKSLNRISKITVIWFVSYYVIGACMFCNHLPWT